MACKICQRIGQSWKCCDFVLDSCHLVRSANGLSQLGRAAHACSCWAWLLTFLWNGPNKNCQYLCCSEYPWRNNIGTYKKNKSCQHFSTCTSCPFCQNCQIIGNRSKCSHHLHHLSILFKWAAQSTNLLSTDGFCKTHREKQKARLSLRQWSKTE